jgi:hypothetical protein
VARSEKFGEILMMTPKPKDVLADLIERLKQASGPDRELDAEIAAALTAISNGAEHG